MKVKIIIQQTFLDLGYLEKNDLHILIYHKERGTPCTLFRLLLTEAWAQWLKDTRTTPSISEVGNSRLTWPLHWGARAPSMLLLWPLIPVVTFTEWQPGVKWKVAQPLSSKRRNPLTRAFWKSRTSAMATWMVLKQWAHLPRGELGTAATEPAMLPWAEPGRYEWDRKGQQVAGTDLPARLNSHWKTFLSPFCSSLNNHSFWEKWSPVSGRWQVQTY